MLTAMPPRWTVVLFDLDGTLVNTVPMMIAAYQQAVRAVVGIELPEDRVRALLGRPLLDNCRELAGDRAAEVYAGEYLAPHTTTLGVGYQLIVPYLVMLIVLLVRPYGLFGTREIERL